MEPATTEKKGSDPMDPSSPLIPSTPVVRRVFVSTDNALHPGTKGFHAPAKFGTTGGKPSNLIP
jgi:hypothetical protein